VIIIKRFSILHISVVRGKGENIQYVYENNLGKIIKGSFLYSRHIRTVDYFILGPYLRDGNTKQAYLPFMS